LTDNGKVFTGRFGPGTAEVLFDRICRENGIKHLLTAPRSPTTTGKIERWHKTLRVEFLTGKTFTSIDDAQAQLDTWVDHYNHDRPHQSIGMVAPWERFRLANRQPTEPDAVEVEPDAALIPATTRRVGRNGLISFAAAKYRKTSMSCATAVLCTSTTTVFSSRRMPVDIRSTSRPPACTAARSRCRDLRRDRRRPRCR
jgi:hypothetical protein